MLILLSRTWRKILLMSDEQILAAYADTNSPIFKISNWLTNNGLNLLNSFLNTGLAITGVVITLPKENTGLTTGFIFLLIFGLGTILSNFLLWKKDHNITKYKATIDDLSCKIEKKQKIIEGYVLMSSDIINNYLSVLSNDTFQLTDSERISLFKFEGDTFIRIGRYSKNPIFKENGRISYPSNEGCISMAWQNGEFFIDQLPDPDKNLKSWCNEQYTKCKVPKDISKKLTMKSRNLFAIAIEDSIHRNRIAVMVIESIKIDAINPRLIKEALNSIERVKLYDLINRMKDIVPDLRTAIEKGF
jgi:hypothetical protein